MMGITDLRSDNVAPPTDEMRRAMYEAEVGNDNFGDDPTVNRLQDLAAELLGTEASLFVSSGTQGNLMALLSLAGKGGTIISAEHSHVETSELDGYSFVAGGRVESTMAIKGVMDPREVDKALAKTRNSPRLIWIENTHNRGGGTVTPIETMHSLAVLARKHRVPIHVDGARLFNAAAFLGVDPRSLVTGADTVVICLSKGLAAPVGSVLCGPGEVVEKARYYRQMLGGQMCQAGVLAAAGIVALEKMTLRLEEDHEKARMLAKALAEIPGIYLDPADVQTNIVFCSLEPSYGPVEELIERLRASGVLALATGPAPNSVRFVTHYQTSQSDIQLTVRAVAAITAEMGAVRESRRRVRSPHASAKAESRDRSRP